MVEITKISFSKRGLGILSPLEHDVLNVLWKNPEGYKVREVHGVLRGKNRAALTSVAVILDRLHDKKLVTRSIKTGRGGEYYIYSCACNEQNFHQTVVEKTVDKLISSYGSTAINYFNERFAKPADADGVKHLRKRAG